MRNTLETRLGLFVALAVVAAVLTLELIGGTELFKPTYELYALFNKVQDLKEGDRVKMAGVEVGKVKEIKLAEDPPNKVKVIMRIWNKVKVRTDSRATIKFTGLMGQNFVSLEFGSSGSPNLSPNSEVPTDEQPDFGDVMKRLEKVATGVEKLTESFTGVKIDKLLGPLTDTIEEARGPLVASLKNMQTISTQIAQGKGTVGTLISDNNALYNSALGTVTNLQEAAAEIKVTVVEARKMIDEVMAGKGTIGTLLKDDTIAREATTTVTTLREIMQKINQGDGSVSKLLNDKELYNNAKLTLQKLEKATEGLEDQGPLSVMGILVNNLF